MNIRSGQRSRVAQGLTLAGTVSAPQVPRLTPEQVIPQIRTVRAEDECLFHSPSYLNVFPARTTQYTGYAVVARDEYQPAIVQQGFKVLDRYQKPPPTYPLNNSANSLLKRNANTWTVCNKIHPITESKYFTRTGYVT